MRKPTNRRCGHFQKPILQSIVTVFATLALLGAVSGQQSAASARQTESGTLTKKEAQKALVTALKGKRVLFTLDGVDYFSNYVEVKPSGCKVKILQVERIGKFGGYARYTFDFEKAIYSMGTYTRLRGTDNDVAGVVFRMRVPIDVRHSRFEDGPATYTSWPEGRILFLKNDDAGVDLLHNAYIGMKKACEKEKK